MPRGEAKIHVDKNARSRTRWRVGLAMALALSAAVTSGAASQTAEDIDRLALLRADTMDYDPATSIVTATGHVEINYKQQTLRAERVIYNQKTDVVVAEGNVVLIDKDGNVVFADRVELKDQMRDGTVNKINMLLSDNSRVAAVEGERKNEKTTVLRKAVFSPCDICEKKPDKAPLWQIKARRVIHDQEKKEIVYNHAFFELFGIPVAYTPYFEHPDPSVKRKSGFLMPTFGGSDLGTVITIPYYWAISDSYDATFTPTYTSEEGPVFRGEFRQQFRKGRYWIDGSITRADERDDRGLRTGRKDIRGHLFAEGRFQFNPVWSWGFDVQEVTDDTYLRRYDISNIDRLQNRLFMEGFEGRNYVSANVYSFQDLRATDEAGQTPLVAPFIDASYTLKPPVLGGRAVLTANLASLTRSQGADIHRLSAGIDWQRRFVTPAGQLITGFAAMRGDFYITNDVPNLSVPGTTRSGRTLSRFLPVAGVEWRWPFAKHGLSTTQLIEPIVQVVYSPNGGNPDDIPNEDSQNFEFDESNLFSYNRFPGYDRWDSGARLNYGLRAAVFFPQDRFIEIYFGQSYRFEDRSPFPAGSGLDDQTSDFVGRIVIEPTPYFRITQRFRLSQDDFSFERNEVTASLNVWRLSAAVTYTRVSPDDAIDSTSREGVAATAALRLSNYWSLIANTQRDITNNRTVFRELGLSYVDECSEFGVVYRRDFTRDRDVAPSNSFLVRFRLTNIG